MFEKPYNQKIVTVKLTRQEVCDLKLACSTIGMEYDVDTEKWLALHEKLKAIINEFDDKNLPV